MNDLKLLLDTNVFIHLEDPKKVPAEIARLVSRCNEFGIPTFIHDAAVTDLNRDRDIERRDISLSKLSKFPRLRSPRLPAVSELEAEFGAIKRPNDEVDVALLHSLKMNAVSLLITEDQGIHDRVKFSPLASRVLTVSDALAWLGSTFDRTPVSLPLISELKAYEVDLADPFFDSLREDYPTFDGWWAKCAQEHRVCWVVTVDGSMAGLIVWKQELPAEALCSEPAQKILKLCTFKVRRNFRGEKLGELLLKQALWFAQRNGFDLTYLTAFAKQESLIRLLEYYGFRKTDILKNNEIVLAKRLGSTKLVRDPTLDLFTQARINYPRVMGPPDAKVFCVPIQGDYHRKLFPELAIREPLPLFSDEVRLDEQQGERTPGNTIRKVYLCRSKVGRIRPGDLLLFYQSKSDGYVGSQSITSLGVVERVSSTENLEDLMRATAKRSVFSQSELQAMLTKRPTALHIIDFLLVGHAEPPVKLATLVKEGIFASDPPQAICMIDANSFHRLRVKFKLGFEI